MNINRQQRVLSLNPLPLAKSESFIKTKSRLDEQIEIFNIYISSFRSPYKRKQPFICTTPLAIVATKKTLSIEKGLKNNKSNPLNKKTILSSRSKLNIQSPQKKINEEQKNSISRWDYFDYNDAITKI